MTKSIINKYVNLLEYPEARILQPHSILTFGDLHGNAIKLLFFLAESGVLTLQHQQDDYQKLVEIYYLEKDLVQSCHLEKFENILKEALFNPIASTIKIRLLGDEVADRGQNDYFTLLILEQLTANNIVIEIIFSNHAAEFIKFYEENCKVDFMPLIFSNNTEYMKSLGCATCSQGLIYLLQKELISKDKILFLVDHAYKNNIKLLSYHMEPIKDHLYNLTIYSHAPIGIENIKALADRFNIIYNSNYDIPLEQFINILDTINKEFISLVANNTLSAALAAELPYLLMQEAHISSLPILKTIWNRVNYPGSASGILFRPQFMSFADQKCKMHYTHGHDGQGHVKGSEQEFVTNLDNSLGMEYNNDYNEDGEYVVEIEQADITIPSLDSKTKNTLVLS